MARFSATVRGRVVWNVNSTGRGGGVAELLAALIPYDLGAGVDERWVVIEGDPEFFDLTKRIHTMLHGVAAEDSDLTGGDRREYEQTLGRNAAALMELMKPGDLAVLHDPQTAGLAPALSRHGVRVVWRSHIGVDRPNEVVRTAWRFLRPYLAAASAVVFSRRAYAWEGFDDSLVHIMPPCIDPFTTKNQDMDDAAVIGILRGCGILRSRDGDTTFQRHDGSVERLRHRARITTALPDEARIVLQVSRWDRLKDPVGVMRAFARYVGPNTDAWLVLAGPGVDSVEDDPEQPEILRELQTVRDAIDPAIRDRVVLAQLPMQDTDENAAIVNALQRRASVVVQKSLAEGFGLTVAEAMWKARPVVASRVGGIEDQIENGRSGVLIDDPADLDAFGRAVVGLLEDQDRASDLGREARLRIIREYLAPRHLMQQARLLTGLI